MSRRMIKAGIEVHGYRNNYKKAEEQFEKGYISGCATSLETLVQVVKEKGPGIFQLVIPAETVESTLNELLPLLSDGDIVIDHGNSNFKDSRRRAERLEKLASNILTAALVVEFLVWTVDSVLWLVVQILQYPSALLSLGRSHQVLDLPLAQTLSVMKPLLSSVGCTVVDLAQVTL